MLSAKMFLTKCQSTYENMLLCNTPNEITGFSHTVVRIFCPVVIILSFAHVAFKKVMLMLCRTCFCKNVKALKYQSVGTALHYSISTVLSRLTTKSSFGEKSSLNIRLLLLAGYTQVTRRVEAFCKHVRALESSTSSANH